ncbi:MAG: addiction module protein [Lysobacterales bacterium]
MIEEALLSKVKRLSPAARLELIGVVWESLELGDLPVTDAQKAELDARIDDELRNPSDVAPWPEVEARLRRRLR